MLMYTKKLALALIALLQAYRYNPDKQIYRLIKRLCRKLKIDIRRLKTYDYYRRLNIIEALIREVEQQWK